MAKFNPVRGSPATRRQMLAIIIRRELEAATSEDDLKQRLRQALSPPNTNAEELVVDVGLTPGNLGDLEDDLRWQEMVTEWCQMRRIKPPLSSNDRGSLAHLLRNVYLEGKKNAQRVQAT